MLTQLTHISTQAVSLVMLVFGGGLVVGNIVGGKLADRYLEATLIGSAAHAGRGAGTDDVRHS